MMRLQFPKTHTGLQTWDTPTPPNIEECILYPWDTTNTTQFKTIDLSQIFGLTFFFSYGGIYDIHAHTKTWPCAQSTYRKLSRRRQSAVAWIYVPISRTDSIALIGERLLRHENTTPNGISLLVSTCIKRVYWQNTYSFSYD